MEKIDFLIDYLIKENKSIDIKEIPQNINDKKRLYRSLCNIREPLPISKEDIETFIEDKNSLDLWSKEFFKEITTNLMAD